MAATAEAYLEPQQLCDYVQLRHINVGKDVETDKLHKVQPNSLVCRCLAFRIFVFGDFTAYCASHSISVIMLKMYCIENVECM